MEWYQYRCPNINHQGDMPVAAQVPDMLPVADDFIFQK